MEFDIEAARASVQGLERHDSSSLLARIRELARPRMSGGEGAEEVEATLKERFAELGYDARELPFAFSTWPGRFGYSVSGAALLVTGIAGAWLLYAGLPVIALAVLAGGLLLALLPFLLAGPAMRTLPWGRIETANLLFTREGRRPSWLIMAHRDSKSQLVPTLARTGVVIAGGVGWVALITMGGLWFAGDAFRMPALVLVAGALVAAAGLVLGLSWAADESPGALDNATGLAVLLAVAEREESGQVGFLVTDGEELGLAGARAAVGAIPPVQGVINLDGLDDRGILYVAEGHGWRRRGSAPQLVAALLSAGRALELDVHRRRLPLSILVDHIPLSASGIPSLTLLRGEWASLGRVHRPADSPDRLDGSGAAETATAVSAALRLLRDSGQGHLAGGGRQGP